MPKLANLWTLRNWQFIKIFYDCIWRYAVLLFEIMSSVRPTAP